MLRICVIGSTGSIGTQTLDVARIHPDKIRIVGLAAHSNIELLQKQANEFRPTKLALYNKSINTNNNFLRGMEGIIECVTADDVDLVVISVAGMIGLGPTIEAIKSKKAIALASKEVLVAGGELVMALVKKHNVQFLPIDSEHSAILQCILGSKNSEIEKLYLTASGGPFRGWKKDKLQLVTTEMALNHPTWKMGGKITIDSATLMNKGLEIIEACWLYNQPPENIEVIVHPQSVIHSMVKFVDGSVLGQLGHPDMKLPIQFALFGEHISPTPSKTWEPTLTPNLEFEDLDHETFICPNLAKRAFKIGGVAPAFLNAVNEEAANAFLREEISFLKIQESCEKSLDVTPKAEATLENILAADKDGRDWFNSQK